MTGNTHKATRLYIEGRVAKLADHVYGVAGDTDVYLVTLADTIVRAVNPPGPAPQTFACTCLGARKQPRRRCSHVLAAMTHRWQEQIEAHAADQAERCDGDPFDGLVR